MARSGPGPSAGGAELGPYGPVLTAGVGVQQQVFHDPVTFELFQARVPQVASLGPSSGHFTSLGWTHSRTGHVAPRIPHVHLSLSTTHPLKRASSTFVPSCANACLANSRTRGVLLPWPGAGRPRKGWPEDPGEAWL